MNDKNGKASIPNESGRFSKTLGVLISQVANLFVNVLALPYMSRALSVHDYGSYSQTVMINDVFVLICSMGISKILYSQLSINKGKEEGVLISSIISAIIFGIIGIGLSFLFSGLFSSTFENIELKELLTIYSLAIPFQILAQIFSATIIYNNNVVLNSRIVVVINIVKVLSIIFVIHFFNSLEYLFWTLNIIAVLNCIILYYYFPFRNIFNASFDLSIVKKSILIGMPLALTSFVGYAYKFTDAFMVGSMLSVEQYAYYRNGAFEIPFISTIYSSISIVLLPDIVKLYHENKFQEIVELKRKIITYTSAIVIPVVIFVIFFNHDIIKFYLSEKYLPSKNIFAIYSLIILLRTNNYEDVLIAAGKTKNILITYILFFLINILIIYFFVYLFNLIGAALASVITMFLLFIVLMKLNSIELKVLILDFYEVNKLLKILMISLFLSFLFFILYNISNGSVIILCLLFLMYFILSLHIILKFSLLDKYIVHNITRQYVPQLSSLFSKIYLN